MHHKNLLLITVDTEAVPARAETEHVERLIWGRFGDRSYGIGRMIEIANDCGVPLTFYLDLCEVDLYGRESLRRVADYIQMQGHEVQTHAHTGLLPPTFWTSRGLPPLTSLDRATEAQALPLIEYLTQEAQAVTGAEPRAFRGAGYRYNDFVLKALAQTGYRISSNYNVWAVGKGHQPGDGRPRAQFRWGNGIIEIPIPVQRFNGKVRQFNADDVDLSNGELMEEYVQQYRELVGADCVFVLMMHSWSFLDKNNERGHFLPAGERKAERFAAFLKHLPSGLEAISTTELLRRAEREEVRMDATLELNYASYDHHPRRTASRQEVRAAEVPSDRRAVDENWRWLPGACPICESGAGEMEDYNRRKKVRCAACGSLERHRVFFCVYHDFIAREFDLRGKTILAASPNEVEVRVLRQLGPVVTCDPRPLKNRDLQLDLCRMPSIGDEEYDCVVATDVLAHLYDAAGALREIKRILRPGGRVLLMTPVRFNKSTIEYTSAGEIEQLWGHELYEKYKMGRYRVYGDLDLMGDLGTCFVVKTFYGRDPVTGVCDVVYCGVKRAR